MDIKKNFSESMNLLFKKEKLILPNIISLLIWTLVFFIMMSATGVLPLLKEISDKKAEFDEKRIESVFNPAVDAGDYGSFSNYLEKEGFQWSDYSSIISAKNIWIFAISITFIILSSYYFSTMSLAMIMMTLKQEKINLRNTIQSTNRFFFRIMWLDVLLMFFIIAPIVLMFALIMGLTFLSGSLGDVAGIILAVSLTILLIFLILGFLIFMGLRTLFAEPIMFYESKTAFGSLVSSFSMTRGKLKKTGLALLVFWGIALFVNSFAGQPMYAALGNVFFETNIIKIITSLILVLLFIILEAAALTFRNIFLFSIYAGFEKD